MITDHTFVEKPYAELIAREYGSELAADIGYCAVQGCNQPREEHADHVAIADQIINRGWVWNI